MMDIHWMINRLKSMNAQEVSWRVGQKLLQKKERREIYKMNWSVLKVPLSKELDRLKADAERIPFNPENSNYTIFENLDIFGQFEYKEYKKKWNAGFQTENVWPEDEFSASIEIAQREDVGDIRINWELNRHFQFVCLAKNYYITGEKKYLYELEDLFENWNSHNLFLHGVEWTSAMELGIRINSWIYMYVFLSNSYKRYSTSETHLLEELEHGILVMSDYIIKHHSRFSSANNHLIIEMYAVAMTGILFRKESWIKYAIDILTEELQRQNYKDGVNKEMSLHYQCFIMEAYGLLGLSLRWNGIKIPELWDRYLTAMSRYVADCCGEFGEVIVFGDSDEGKILDIQGRIEDYYRYVLQLMGIFLQNRYINQPIVENISWIATLEQLNEYNLKPLYELKTVASYIHGGYAILRSRDHRVLIGVDYAELGLPPIAAHGHADALSVQLFFDGKPILIDSGTYNYHVPKSIRNEIRLAKAHNTVYVDGIEQAEILGPFLWGKRYKVESKSIVQNDRGIEIDASISYSGILHRRRISFDYERRLVIEDIVHGTSEAVQNWIFAGEDAFKLVELQSTGEVKSNKKVLYSKLYCEKSEAERIEICMTSNKVKTIITVR